MTRFEFDLPIPPSTNGAYANKDGGGRVKVKAVKVYHMILLMALQPYINAHRKHCDDIIIHRMKACRTSKGVRANSVGTIQKSVKHARPSYALTYRFYFPDDAVRDIANFEKILTDILVEVGFMLDDQFVDRFLLIRETPDPIKPRVNVTLENILK